jgi:hypothetical protein
VLVPKEPRTLKLCIVAVKPYRLNPRAPFERGYTPPYYVPRGLKAKTKIAIKTEEKYGKITFEIVCNFKNC